MESPYLIHDAILKMMQSIQDKQLITKEEAK